MGLFGSLLREAQELLQLGPVEPDHRLIVDERDRRCPESHLDQFVHRALVRPDVLHRELHAFSRKILFLLVTGASAGLAVHNDLLGHGSLLYSKLTETSTGRKASPV